MTDELKPPMPAQPTTKQIPAVMVPSTTLDAVLQEVRATRADVASLANGVDVLTHQQQMFGQRLTLVEKRQDDADKRADTSSLRAKDPSAHDLAAFAELANERASREAIAADVTAVKSDIAAIKADLTANTASTELIRAAVTGVGGFLKQHPNIVIAFATLLATALGAATHWLAAGGH